MLGHLLLLLCKNTAENVPHQLIRAKLPTPFLLYADLFLKYLAKKLVNQWVVGMCGKCGWHTPYKKTLACVLNMILTLDFVKGKFFKEFKSSEVVNGKNNLIRGVKNHKKSNPHLWERGEWCEISGGVALGWGEGGCAGMAIKKLFKFWEPHIICTVCMGNCFITVMSPLSRKQNKKFVSLSFSLCHLVPDSLCVKLFSLHLTGL